MGKLKVVIEEILSGEEVQSFPNIAGINTAIRIERGINMNLDHNRFVVKIKDDKDAKEKE